MDGEGNLLSRGAEFAEEWFVVDVPVAEPRPVNGTLFNIHTRPTARRDPPEAREPRKPMDDVEPVWNALVTGVRDYTELNGFKGVALGLSGGIDSAVTAMIATDSLGPERVLAVAMTRRYAPPGIKITSRAFDQDRHMPLTNSWRAHRRN